MLAGGLQPINQGLIQKFGAGGANELRGHITACMLGRAISIQVEDSESNSKLGGSGGPPLENFENLPPKWCIWGRT